METHSHIHAHESTHIQTKTREKTDPFEAITLVILKLTQKFLINFDTFLKNFVIYVPRA